MLTYALLGLGRRIVRVTENLNAAAQGRIRLLGWCDPSPAGLPRLGTLGIETGQGYTDPEKMLRELKPDVLLIGSPNHLHLDHIKLGFAAGCTVFCEKPVTISPEQTFELATLMAKYGQQRLHVGLVLRSSPLFRRVYDLVRDGRIGRLVSFEANEHLGPEHGGYIMRDWRRYRRHSGSYLLEKCCHDFDLYNALVGRRAVRVASFGGRDIFVPENAGLAQGPGVDGKERYQSWAPGWDATRNVFDSDADVLDNQVALVEYQGGARLAFHSNTHCAYPQRRWLLAGTHGTIESDLQTGKIRFQPVFGASEELGFGDSAASHYGSDQAMGKNLAAALLDGAPGPVPAVASLEAGLLCMAIDQAQRENRMVDLAPWWQRLDATLAGEATVLELSDAAASMGAPPP